MTNIVGPDLVLLDVDAGTDKESVIGRLAGLLTDAGRAADTEALKEAALARRASRRPACPAGSRFRTAVQRRCWSPRSASPGYAHRWTSAHRTDRPIWCS